MNAEVYTGKVQNDPTFVDELGVTGSLVVRLSQHYRNQNYCLYTDRFYTSVSLAEYLMEHFHIRSVGTALTNRKRFPKEILRKKWTEVYQKLSIMAGLVRQEANILHYNQIRGFTHCHMSTIQCRTRSKSACELS